MFELRFDVSAAFRVVHDPSSRSDNSPGVYAGVTNAQNPKEARSRAFSPQCAEQMGVAALIPKSRLKPPNRKGP